MSSGVGEHLDNQTYPEGTKREVAAALGRGALGVIPVAGSGLAELFSWVVLAPLAKRRDKWMNDIGRRLQRLEAERGVRIEDLGDSDEFVTVVSQASQIALRNHQHEKHDALKAAVTNAAIDVEPDVDQQLMFIRWIDDLTVTHLQILRFLDNPPAFLEARGGSYQPALSSNLSAPLELAMPELAGRKDFYTLVASELEARGLVGNPGFNTMMSAHGWTSSRTTQIGQSFMQFITDPFPTEQS